MVFIRFPFNYHLKYVDCENISLNADLLRDTIATSLGSNDFTLFFEEKPLYCDQKISNNATVYVSFSLPGGKGGFGSMLRAIGAQIEKTTNREACRDLSGRRLRDINEEQRIKKWLAKESERKAEKIKRRQARIERLKSKPKHQFNDYEFHKEVSSNRDRIDNALSEGLKKVKNTKSDSSVEKLPVSEKRAAQWLKDDFSDTSSSDSDEGSASGASHESPLKKQKLETDDSCSSYSDYFAVPSENSNSNFSEARLDGKPDIPTQSCSSHESPVRMEFNEDNSNEKFTRSESSYSARIAHASENFGGNYVQDKKFESRNIPAEISSELNSQHKEKSNVDSTLAKQSIQSVKNGAESASKTFSDIDLISFQNVSELEALSLDQLKYSLMLRGLKCGGTLADRAQRLWQVRGLQPDQYPANLLAKKK